MTTNEGFGYFKMIWSRFEAFRAAKQEDAIRPLETSASTYPSIKIIL
jgi:hypothetical protein